MDMYLYDLDRVNELGFTIEENVTGVLEVNKVTLDKKTSFQDFVDEKYETEFLLRNYDLYEIDYTLKKDDITVLESASREEIVNFFLDGTFVSYVSADEIEKINTK